MVIIHMNSKTNNGDEVTRRKGWEGENILRCHIWHFTRLYHTDIINIAEFLYSKFFFILNTYKKCRKAKKCWELCLQYANHEKR